MGKIQIKAKDVTFEVEKTDGSGTYVRMRCLSDLGLSITTATEEVTCSDSEDMDGNQWKEFEAGINEWSGSGTLFVRQLTDVPAGQGGTPPAQTDATDGVSAADMLRYQIAGRKLRVGFTMGIATGSVRLRGRIILNKFDLKGGLTGGATASIGFQGTGPLNEDAVPA